MLKYLVLTAATVIAAPLSPLAHAQAKRFVVRNDGGSRVQFVSDAPLETITGVTSGLSGELRVDPRDLSTVRGRVQATVASLRTGVDLRDENLREEGWLYEAQNTHAVIEVTRVEGSAELRPNEAITAEVRGRFMLHGVTRDVATTARVRLIPLTEELARTPGINGDVLRIQATFTVRLTDYNVSVPLPVRLKVSNDVQVNVDLRAIAAVVEVPRG
jgi:polyisoprenoid-binding protein YceI